MVKEIVLEEQQVVEKLRSVPKMKDYDPETMRSIVKDVASGNTVKISVENSKIFFNGEFACGFDCCRAGNQNHNALNIIRDTVKELTGQQVTRKNIESLVTIVR